MEPTSLDLSLRLLRHGYDGIEAERRRQHGQEPLVTRMLGRRTVVVRGTDGARLFYDPDVVQRAGSIPLALRGLLFGRGGVQGLDGRAHAARKSLFLDLCSEDRIEPLVADVERRLRERVDFWQRPVQLFDELTEVYGGAVLAWAGIDTGPEEADRLSRAMAEMVDGIGFSGLAYLRGWRSRIRLNRWADSVIRRRRAVSSLAPPSPVDVLASRGDLDTRTAGVELLNLLRPTVAVAWPATLALNRLLRETEREEIVSGALLPYLHECRRRQPFAPALGGRVRRDIDYRGVPLRTGDRIVLDIIGTHDDPATWPGHGGPEAFSPERFAETARGGSPDPYALVPHGGGDPATGHRCPGEPLAVRLLGVTAATLVGAVEAVTGGEPDRSRIPTLPTPPLQVRKTTAAR